MGSDIATIMSTSWRVTGAHMLLPSLQRPCSTSQLLAPQLRSFCRCHSWHSRDCILSIEASEPSPYGLVHDAALITAQAELLYAVDIALALVAAANSFPLVEEDIKSTAAGRCRSLSVAEAVDAALLLVADSLPLVEEDTKSTAEATSESCQLQPCFGSLYLFVVAVKIGTHLLHEQMIKSLS